MQSNAMLAIAPRQPRRARPSGVRPAAMLNRAARGFRAPAQAASEFAARQLLRYLFSE